MQPGYSSSPNHLNFLIAKVISTSKTMIPDPKQTNNRHEFGQLPTKLTPVQRILTQFAVISTILLMMIGPSYSSSIEGPAGFIPDNHSDIRTLACFSDSNRTHVACGVCPARPEHSPSLQIPPTAVVGTDDGRQGSLPTSTGEERPPCTPAHERGESTAPAGLQSTIDVDSTRRLPVVCRRVRFINPARSTRYPVSNDADSTFQADVDITCSTTASKALPCWRRRVHVAVWPHSPCVSSIPPQTSFFGAAGDSAAGTNDLNAALEINAITSNSGTISSDGNLDLPDTYVRGWSSMTHVHYHARWEPTPSAISSSIFH